RGGRPAARGQPRRRAYGGHRDHPSHRYPPTRYVVHGRRSARPPMTEARADDAAPEVRVVIAEDSAILRDGLVALLTRRGNDVVAAVPDREALVARVADLVAKARSEEHTP